MLGEGNQVKDSRGFRSRVGARHCLHRWKVSVHTNAQCWGMKVNPLGWKIPGSFEILGEKMFFSPKFGKII